MNQLNASMRALSQELVERRLWPVALVLVIALIAIPVLLSKSSSGTEPTSEPATPVAPATGSGGKLPAFEPAVSTEGKKSSEIEKNLQGFDSKDPFKVQGLPSVASTAGDAGVADAAAASGGSATTTGADTTSGSGSDSGSGTSGSGSQGTSGSGESTGESGGVTYFTWTATVRFGIGENPDKKRLERFRALPSSENPVVVFMGATVDGDKAVFLVSAATGTTGEGDCEPDDTCTFLYMKPGQTQTFESVGDNDQVVTYTLKLIEVNAEETEPPASSSSRRTTASSKRRARRAERKDRDRRDNAFSARVEAVGF